MSDLFVAQIDGHTFLSPAEVSAYYTWLVQQGSQGGTNAARPDSEEAQ
ncbi:hypothetical protein [Streptomyces sp. 5-10]|nr:hypothetical protein [Streptomyces sp. 5-10]MBD3004663.1 hypothetical protein [Streptomyces sp. 5-10]